VSGERSRMVRDKCKIRSEKSILRPYFVLQLECKRVRGTAGSRYHVITRMPGMTKLHRVPSTFNYCSLPPLSCTGTFYWSFSPRLKATESTFTSNPHSTLSYLPRSTSLHQNEYQTTTRPHHWWLKGNWPLNRSALCQEHISMYPHLSLRTSFESRCVDFATSLRKPCAICKHISVSDHFAFTQCLTTPARDFAGPFETFLHRWRCC
jgi:hypothetical protein